MTTIGISAVACILVALTMISQVWRLAGYPLIPSRMESAINGVLAGESSDDYDESVKALLDGLSDVIESPSAIPSDVLAKSLCLSIWVVIAFNSAGFVLFGATAAIMAFG